MSEVYIFAYGTFVLTLTVAALLQVGRLEDARQAEMKKERAAHKPATQQSNEALQT